MTAHPAYTSATIFERTSDWNFTEVIISGSMLRIYYLIDGKRSISYIGETLNVTDTALRPDLQKLLELNLVKTVALAAPAQPYSPVRSKMGDCRRASMEVA